MIFLHEFAKSHCWPVLSDASVVADVIKFAVSVAIATAAEDINADVATAVGVAAAAEVINVAVVLLLLLLLLLVVAAVVLLLP